MWGVSAAVGGVSLVIAAIMWWILHDQHHRPFWRPAILLLAFTGSAGLTGTALGRWERTAVGYVSDGLAYVTTQLGVTIAFEWVAVTILVVVVSAMVRHLSRHSN